MQAIEDAYVRGEITALSPRVASHVVEILADGNATVAAHQVPVRIAPCDFRVAVEQVAATVAQLQASLAAQRQVVAQVEADAQVGRAAVASAEAALATARLALQDTEIWAPIAGSVANRRTRMGEYITPGTRLLSLVPGEGLWIEANFREMQIGGTVPAQLLEVGLDTHPDLALCGYVESIGTASGSEFALFPGDNATGNFTKILRRFPVRFRVNLSDPGEGLVRQGMSARVTVGVTGDVGCRFDPPPAQPAAPTTAPRRYWSVPPMIRRLRRTPALGSGVRARRKTPSPTLAWRKRFGRRGLRRSRRSPPRSWRRTAIATTSSSFSAHSDAHVPMI